MRPTWSWAAWFAWPATGSRAGGWIASPAGAHVLSPTITGRATFGFVSKYEKGANVATGQTEFLFGVANLNFHSTSYEWLVIAGPKAQYKGEGTINGSGSYRFMLTAIDGQINGGGGVDKFRIRIWGRMTTGATAVWFTTTRWAREITRTRPRSSAAAVL